MDSDTVQVSVARTDRNDTTVWFEGQPVRVTFQTYNGPVEAWLDHDGFLVLRSSQLMIMPDGQSQIRVRA